jgi:acetyl-CoA carboxylase biotin carboxyl carrier protein
MRIKGIKKLIELVEESKISELEVSRFGTRVRIQKDSNASKQVATGTDSTHASTETRDEREVTSPKMDRGNFVPIKSPMVGTFYRSSAPDSPPYVEVNDIVKTGQVICIVEAMKLMNEIEADVSGKIMEVLVKNETPVEYGEILFHIEPM